MTHHERLRNHFLFANRNYIINSSNAAKFSLSITPNSFRRATSCRFLLLFLSLLLLFCTFCTAAAVPHCRHIDLFFFFRWHRFFFRTKCSSNRVNSQHALRAPHNHLLHAVHMWAHSIFIKFDIGAMSCALPGTMTHSQHQLFVLDVEIGVKSISSTIKGNHFVFFFTSTYFFASFPPLVLLCGCKSAN